MCPAGRSHRRSPDAEVPTDYESCLGRALSLAKVYLLTAEKRTQHQLTSRVTSLFQVGIGLHRDVKDLAAKASAERCPEDRHKDQADRTN